MPYKKYIKHCRELQKIFWMEVKEMMKGSKKSLKKSEKKQSKVKSKNGRENWKNSEGM